MTTIYLPEIRDVSNAVRPLGAMEHLLLLINQVSPVHFTMTAEVVGRTSIDGWRRALDLVQKRHTLLSVTIGGAPGAVPWIRKTEGSAIPLRVVHDDSSERWVAEVSDELAKSFDHTRSPLVRAVLVHSEERATLTFVAHHSIADGLSLAFVLRDTVSALAGESLERLPPLASMEDLVRDKYGDFRVLDEAETSAEPPQSARAVFRTDDGSKPQIRKLQLSPALTADLVRRAKEEETTVHGALCAALTVAGRRSFTTWQNRSITLLSAVSLRRLLGVEDDCGLFVGGARSETEAEQQNFWDMARKSKADISPSQTMEGAQAFAETLEKMADSKLTVADAAEFSAVAFAAQALITNLGVMPFENKFGSLEIQAMWGPCVIRHFEGHHSLGVATINESICLVHTTFERTEGLLEAVAEVIEEACSESRRQT
jgi:NRPS condensation-like uncharacterized protein